MLIIGFLPRELAQQTSTYFIGFTRFFNFWWQKEAGVATTPFFGELSYVKGYGFAMEMTKLVWTFRILKLPWVTVPLCADCARVSHDCYLG